MWYPARIKPVWFSVLKRRKPRASSCDKGICRHLIPSGPHFAFGSRGACKRFAFDLKDMELCQVLPGLETLTKMGRVGKSVCFEGVHSQVGRIVLSLKLLPSDLEASWDSKAPSSDHSLLCERGKVTWPCNSIYFITDFMWVVPRPSLEYNGYTRHCTLTYCPASLEKP